MLSHFGILGFMVEFISAPVISGFCSAAALTVASTQIKSLFGLKFKGSAFVDVWYGFFTHVTEIKKWDALLGCTSIVVLLLMRVPLMEKWLKNVKNEFCLLSQKLTSLKNLPLRIECLQNQYVDKCLWFIATSRNAIAVITGCVAAYYLEQQGLTPFTLTGKNTSSSKTKKQKRLVFENRRHQGRTATVQLTCIHCQSDRWEYDGDSHFSRNCLGIGRRYWSNSSDSSTRASGYC